MFDFEEALKNLPDSPGVYIMKNSEKQIIYIGKAVSLKNRVRQYFQNSKNHSPKVKAMVSHIAEFEYILVDSELEALILECNLIKKHKPRYNILLKDDKHYPYIKVTVNEEYPRIFIARKILKDKAKYFGPYADAGAVKETIKTVKQLYPIRSCHKHVKFGEKIDRPCLNYHIGRCLAPCTGKVPVDEYMSMVNDIMLLLEGKQDELIEKLANKMQSASENLNFEAAAAYRDQINAVKKMQERQKIISTDFVNQDVIASSRNNEYTCIEIFFVRGGKFLGRKNFFFEDTFESIEETISQFIIQFYSEVQDIPSTIMCSMEPKNAESLEEYLTGKKGSRVKIKVPQKGEKYKLIEMAERNAESAIEQKRYRTDREKHDTIGAIEEIKAILNLEKVPRRIEAFDISNIQGVDSVASMVVFEDGRPSNRDYRRFKIKNVEGPNDYASMEEVIERRFTRGLSEAKEIKKSGGSIEDGKFSKFPDLIMMDGGEGQVNSAKKILKKLNITIPVCGMVKDDYHRTRGLIYEDNEIEIYKDSGAFRLSAKIQDEAHRFAITYHRSLRSKRIVHSELTEIAGVGKTRAMAIMNHFKTIDDVKKASIDDIINVKGMNRKAAEAVYNYFHGNK